MAPPGVDLLVGASRDPVFGPVVLLGLGGVVAEALAGQGRKVALVTSAGTASAWTAATLEQPYIQARLLAAGIDIHVSHTLARIDDGGVEIANVYSGVAARLEAAAVVMVTGRLPVDTLYRDLRADQPLLLDAGIRSLLRIGDCLSPGTIAAAVYGGHRAARELDAGENDLTHTDVPFRRERIAHDS
jgi:dimethylamine/trimethylamine dehydrogenase